MEPFSEPIISSQEASGESSWHSSLQDHSQDDDAHKPIVCQSDIRTDFKRLVKNIAEDITDLEKLRYMSDVVQASQVKSHSSLEILWTLERKGRFAFDNVGPLEKLLQDIDRFDLISKHVVPYKLKYKELAINGAIQKKPPTMRRVESSPIPQSSPVLSSQSRRTLGGHMSSTSNHLHPDRMLTSLPGSLRTTYSRFETVPEEETSPTERSTCLHTHNPFTSLPSNAAIVAGTSHSYSIRMGIHSTTLPSNNLSSTHDNDERPIAQALDSRHQESDEHSNHYPWRKTRQSHDHGRQSREENFPHHSLPSNLNHSKLQPRRSLAGSHSSLLWHRTGSRQVVGGASVDQSEPPSVDILDDTFSMTEFESSMASSVSNRFPPHHDMSRYDQLHGRSRSQSRASLLSNPVYGQPTANGHLESCASATYRNTGNAQKTEQSLSWDVEQVLLFNGIRKVGEPLSKVVKFTLPVSGCSKGRNPVITIRVIPRETKQSRHVTIKADVLIPKKCSKRKWFVEYCNCSYLFSVQVINPATNEIVNKDEVYHINQPLLCTPDVEDDHHTTLRLPNFLDHKDVIYNEDVKRFKFHATLALLEHGYRKDSTASQYQMTSCEDEYEMIDPAEV